MAALTIALAPVSRPIHKSGHEFCERQLGRRVGAGHRCPRGRGAARRAGLWRRQPHQGVERRFAELFERDVAVFLVAHGTAANALGLSTYARPGGVIFCHREAHIIVDEAGASEFFGGGVKVVGIEGDGGKLAPEALAAAMARFPEGFVHHGQPVAVSLTQITELGDGLRAGRDRGARDDRQGPRRGRSHGRSALCRRGRRARRFAGRHDLAGRRRRALLRRHQERLHRRRGGGLLRPGARRATSVSRASGRGRGSPRTGSSRPSSRPISRTATGSTSPVTPTTWARALLAPSQSPRRRGWRSSPPPTRSSQSCRGRPTPGSRLEAPSIIRGRSTASQSNGVPVPTRF